MAENALYKKDGTPLCPECEEDELYSPHFATTGRKTPPTIHEYCEWPFGCAACGWTGRIKPPQYHQLGTA